MNAESLEEVLNILAEEGSDWLSGFFSFLFEERGEAAASKEEGGVTSDPREEGEPQPGSGPTVDQ